MIKDTLDHNNTGKLNVEENECQAEVQTLTKEFRKRVGSPEELPEHILRVPEGEVFMEVASVVVTAACRTTRQHPISTHVGTPAPPADLNRPTTALSPPPLPFVNPSLP